MTLREHLERYTKPYARTRRPGADEGVFGIFLRSSRIIGSLFASLCEG